MSSEAGSIGLTLSRSDDGGVLHEDSAWNESSVFLPGSETSNTAESWSKRSLAPGFIWIQTGTVPLHPTSISTFT